MDEPEVSIHPGAQEKLKEYLLDAIIKKKIQIVVSTHSPILIKELPSEAIKLYVTNSEGNFEVRQNVDYQEAFFDLEDCVLEKKVIFCEDYAAKKIIHSMLKKMNKNQYFDVEYNPGGEKTLITKYLPTFTTHELFKNKVYLILDGDMKTDFVFDKDSLIVSQLRDASFLETCVEKAFDTKIEVYVDGGNGGVRQDQKIGSYLRYLDYYNQNVYYLADKQIPEVILLDSNYAHKEFQDVLDRYDVVTNENAKKIIADISIEDYGTEEHIHDIIDRLAYKWSLEDGAQKEYYKNILLEIFQKN